VLEEPKLLAFIVDNFRLMAMGKINAHELEGVLEQELEAIHEELNSRPSRWARSARPCRASAFWPRCWAS
jgi:chemotaxis protein MotA